jgi:hypothetical protein
MFSSLLRHPFSQPGTLFSLALIYKFNWLKSIQRKIGLKLKDMILKNYLFYLIMLITLTGRIECQPQTHLSEGICVKIWISVSFCRLCPLEKLLQKSFKIAVLESSRITASYRGQLTTKKLKSRNTNFWKRFILVKFYLFHTTLAFR